MRASTREYDRKRDFGKTREPKANRATKAGHRYLIQKHAASRLHYDFRLELDGVLKSWAVPKEPSLNPKDKRLAVMTEDHPLEYATFEGTIPKGEYGGGTVKLWDTGTWKPIGDARTGIQKGKLEFEVHGKRLHGRWNLVRLGKSNGKKSNWLLIKGRDDIARSASGSATAFPKSIQPQLATLVDKAPVGEDWIHETKYDGYRILAFKDHDRVTLKTRNHNDYTDRFPDVAKALTLLDIETAVLDGEVAAVDKNGTTDFQALQNSLQEGEPADVQFFLFDMLYANGEDLRELPLVERKKRLASLFPGKKKKRAIGPCVYSAEIQGSGSDVFASACQLGLEGIISKNLHAPYVSTRSESWQKVKCTHRQEFVIGGYTDPEGSRGHFGALLLGYFNEKRELIYAGNVGTGFTAASLQSIHKVLEKNATDRSPFHGKVPRAGSVHWVKPKQIAEIQFHQWTRDRLLRQASFKGLRSDKTSSEVTREMPKKAAPPQTTKLTHPDKVLFSEQGLTKRDLANYYEKIATRILPHLVNRPLSLVRCPAGSDKACFFQRHPNGLADGIENFRAGKENLTYVKDLDGLLALVQYGALEIHPWGSTIEAVEKPDRITFDLDPDDAVPWKEVIAAAKLIRDSLETVGLRSFVKTSGGKGLHVVVPIRPEHNWDEVKGFAKAVAEQLEAAQPERFLATMSKAKRRGKIFIDYLRNARSATSVAAYSTRAKPDAPVSMPITWDELSPRRGPKYFTLGKLLKMRSVPDAWDGFFEVDQRLTLEK